jgi:hypothetical protein
MEPAARSPPGSQPNFEPSRIGRAPSLHPRGSVLAVQARREYGATASAVTVRLNLDGEMCGGAFPIELDQLLTCAAKNNTRAVGRLCSGGIEQWPGGKARRAFPCQIGRPDIGIIRSGIHH